MKNKDHDCPSACQKLADQSGDLVKRDLAPKWTGLKAFLKTFFGTHDLSREDFEYLEQKRCRTDMRRQGFY